jgi:hypothetical protein
MEESSQSLVKVEIREEWLLLSMDFKPTVQKSRITNFL